MLDTPFTSIPVSWKTLVKYVNVVENDAVLDTLEHTLSSTSCETADTSSQLSTTTQELILMDILGENSEFIQSILDSVKKVSVDNAGQFTIGDG